MLKKLLAYCLSICMLLSLTACSQSYEDDIEDYFRAIYYCDWSEDVLLELAPEKFWQSCAELYDYEDLDLFFADLENAYKELVGGEHTEYDITSYGINDKEELSKKELKKVIQSLEEGNQEDYGEAEEGYKFTVKSNFDKEEVINDVIAIKIDEEWYLVNAYPSEDEIRYQWIIAFQLFLVVKSL